MSVEGTLNYLASSSQYQGDTASRRQGALKRKLDFLVPYIWPEDLSYPSPPMSSPPSPNRTQPHEVASGTARSIREDTTTSRGPASTVVPALATTLPSAQAAFPQAVFGQPFGAAPRTIVPSSAFDQAGARVDPSNEQIRTAAPSIPATPSTAGPSASVRGGRRAKAHVASACINCKRAHLSCDVQRPCTRCVASGKEDTCVDVQHKKRGRPRLREEEEFRAGQVVSEPTTQPAASAGPSIPPVRPIAGTRQRRAESFRSLQSQTSDESPAYSASTPGYRPAAILQSPFSGHHPSTPSILRPSYETATAFLNLDFVILRANRPFEQIMTAGQDVRGRHIAEIAAPADNEGFQAIRNRLRAERESREPAYMPPIMHFGQDPVQGISEAEADRFTDGFSDRTYTWTRSQPAAAAEHFPARVRLAKASAYFVVVTLPSFRPVDSAPLQPAAPNYAAPFTLGPPLQAPERFVATRQTAPQSAPPPAYFPFPGPPAAMPPQPLPGAGQLTTSRTYPPPHPTMPFQQQQQYPFYQPSAPIPSRLPIAEPPVETMAFTPRSTPREAAPPPGTGELHLPPLVGSQAAGPSGASVGQTATQEASSDDDEEAEGERRLRSPKKRRRMGIDDVLQR